MEPKVGQYWIGINSHHPEHVFIRKVVSRDLDPLGTMEHRSIGYIGWGSGPLGGTIEKEDEGKHIYYHSLDTWNSHCKEIYFLHPIPEEKALMLIRVWSGDLTYANPV